MIVKLKYIVSTNNMNPNYYQCGVDLNDGFLFEWISPMGNLKLWL